MNGNTYVKKNTTYRACIKNQLGHTVAILKGKRSSQQELDTFIAEHWKAPLTWSLGPMEAFRDDVLQLTVWKYWGGVNSRVCITARKFSD